MNPESDLGNRHTKAMRHQRSSGRDGLWQRCTNGGGTDTYQLAGGPWEEMVLHNKIPCLRCEFDGRQELFRLDTGSGSGMVLFHSPAVERLNLLQDRRTTPSTIGGVGGCIEARIGKLSFFTCGGRRFPGPAALFVTSQAGALSGAYTAGTFGGEFLKPFKVVFDYPHQPLGFVEKPEAPH